jgi:hypothetical protein
MATEERSGIAMVAGARITGLLTPVANDEPATKAYADQISFNYGLALASAVLLY